MFNKETNINTGSEKNVVGIWFYETQHKVTWKTTWKLYLNQTDFIIHLEAGWVSSGLFFSFIHW